MSKTIVNLTVAMPTDGNDIENLNPDKFAQNIANNLRKLDSDYRYSVEVIDNDGTAEDDLSAVPEHVDIASAISNAFWDEGSYGK